MAISGINQKELIELVQAHHPHMGEVEIRKLLNRAQDIICEETEILRRWFSDTTVADQRLYTFDELILKVNRVELTDSDGNYYMIPRLSQEPVLGDTT